MKQIIGYLALWAALGFALTGCGEAEAPDAADAIGTAATDTALAGTTEAGDAAVPGTASAPVFSADSVLSGYAGDIIYGNPDAEIEIIEYASMTCPHCASFASTIFPQVDEAYIQTGKAKFIFRNLVTNSLDLAATVAARCGGEETSGPLTKALFSRQSEWLRSQDPLAEIASIVRKAGISRTKLDQCLKDRPLHEALVKVGQDGTKLYDITGTPTVIVDGAKLKNYAFDTIADAMGD